MIGAMYSAISGLKEHQVMLDVTANNLANVNTIGYKASRATFKDQLAQNFAGGAASGATSGGQNPQQVGLGVALSSVDNLITAGNLQTTGNPLDCAVSGEGWFRVAPGVPPAMPAAGSVEYTRAGNFTRNDQGYLVTSEGYYVMGRDFTSNTDQYIQIPAGATGTAIAGDGTVSYIPTGGGARVTASTISLAKFPNENGLVRASGNRWQVDPSSGAETVGQPGGTYGSTIGGTLEASNVDLANEFTAMIVAQRGLEANSRVISASDEILQTLVNLKH
ncbi:flagellar hook-basal body complex protein [Paraconexibacter antarcticus]|uniref:Flagellar hook protein FlgE n=1 Tax=Paraconexibacter antarcticus TaxID=2949664 RepID=A0ABY5DSU5_9ACTN|nr:flagellar hook-basal body complex protein [Paraconexibacter antarcticus]UTI64669.1 flagellar hook-basal body complex protein [Paraconexibacter antarcticus]